MRAGHQGCMYCNVRCENNAYHPAVDAFVHKKEQRGGDRRGSGSCVATCVKSPCEKHLSVREGKQLVFMNVFQ